MDLKMIFCWIAYPHTGQMCRPGAWKFFAAHPLQNVQPQDNRADPDLGAETSRVSYKQISYSQGEPQLPQLSCRCKAVSFASEVHCIDHKISGAD